MEIYGNEINCEPSDYAWIKEQLSKLPYKELVPASVNSYNRHYELVEGADITQQGVVRRETNARLRKYVNKVLEGMK